MAFRGVPYHPNPFRAPAGTDRHWSQSNETLRRSDADNGHGLLSVQRLARSLRPSLPSMPKDPSSLDWTAPRSEPAPCPHASLRRPAAYLCSKLEISV